MVVVWGEGRQILASIFQRSQVNSSEVDIFSGLNFSSRAAPLRLASRRYQSLVAKPLLSGFEDVFGGYQSAIIKRRW